MEDDEEAEFQRELAAFDANVDLAALPPLGLAGKSQLHGHMISA